MARPVVSTIIPAFNAAPTIRRAVDSVLAQTAPPDQIVVCDDGSTDGTAAILAEYGSRVEVIRQPNRGRGAARNACLARATGEFIALLDADDWWKPTRIARQLDAAEADPEAGLYYANAHIVNAAGQIYRAMNGEWHVGHSGWVFGLLVRQNFVPTSTVLVRSVVARAAGPFEEKLPRSQDLEWLLRIAAIAPFRYLNEVLACYDDRNWGTDEKQHQTYECFRRLLDYVETRHPALAAQHRREFEKSRSDCHAELGRTYENARRFSEAAGCYGRALRHTPQSPWLRRRHAIALYRAGDLPAAVDAFAGILAQDPYDIEARFYLGTIHLASDRPDAARTELTSALYDGFLYQKFPECVNNLGVAWARLGDRGRAAELFDQALDQQAFYSDALVNRDVNAGGADPALLKWTPRRVFAS